jgi:hypothetical protein
MTTVDDVVPPDVDPEPPVADAMNSGGVGVMSPAATEVGVTVTLPVLD